MVEKISVSPLDVRGYGNVLSTKDKSELLLSESFVELLEDTVDGSVRSVFRMFYNDPSLLFSFDRVEKLLYLNVDDGALSFSNKGLVVDSNTYEFGFEDKVLFIDDDVEPVHIYSLSFSESSYEASGGSAVLSLTLLDNSLPVDGALVSVTGSDSSSYTAATNSLGVATVTVNNISADTTFTATYSNVSDSCTVIVPVSPYLFYDECNSASGLSNYANPVTVRRSGNCTLAYDSNGYYTTKITGTTAFQVLHPIISLDGKNIHKLTVELYPETGTNNGAGLCIFNDTNNFFSLYTNYQNRIYETSRLNGNEIDTNRGSCSVMNKWQKYEFILENGTVTLNVYDLSDNRVFTTTTNLRITIGSSTKIGIAQTWQADNVVRIRNIKVE